MVNNIYVEEKKCTIEETGEEVVYLALMWRIGSQVIQLKPVFKAGTGAIKTLVDTGSIEFKKLDEVK